MIISWKFLPKVFCYSVCFVNTPRSIISLLAARHKWYETERMPSFIGIYPHLRILSELKGFGTGKKIWGMRWFQKWYCSRREDREWVSLIRIILGRSGYPYPVDKELAVENPLHQVDFWIPNPKWKNMETLDKYMGGWGGICQYLVSY